MKDRLMILIVTLLAAIIVSIIHEFPKSLVYYRNSENKRKKYINSFLVHKYLDPIGIILFITFFAGFSRPYAYGISKKKCNLYVGLCGFFSMIILCLLSSYLFRLFSNYGNELVSNDSVYNYIYCFLYFMVIFSVSMLVVNLFPISTFDSAFIVAGIFPEKYFKLVVNDMIVKAFLLFSIILEMPKNIGLFYVQCLE